VIYSYKALSDIAPKSGQATSDSGAPGPDVTP
jgi:hypothetical protein